MSRFSPVTVRQLCKVKPRQFMPRVFFFLALLLLVPISAYAQG